MSFAFERAVLILEPLLMFLIWKNVENFGNTAIFPGEYGRIGDIPHGRIYGQIGVYRVYIHCVPMNNLVLCYFLVKIFVVVYY